MIIVAVILFILGLLFAAIGGEFGLAIAAIFWIPAFFIGISASVKAGTKNLAKKPTKRSASGWAL